MSTILKRGENSAFSSSGTWNLRSSGQASRVSGVAKYCGRLATSCSSEVPVEAT